MSIYRCKVLDRSEMFEVSMSQYQAQANAFTINVALHFLVLPKESESARALHPRVLGFHPRPQLYATKLRLFRLTSKKFLYSMWGFIIF